MIFVQQKKKKMGAVYFQWSFSSILACFTVRDRGKQIGRYINLVDKETNLKTTWLSFCPPLRKKNKLFLQAMNINGMDINAQGIVVFFP